MEIGVFTAGDLPRAVGLWNESISLGRFCYKPQTEESFEAIFLKNPHESGDYLLAAREKGGGLLGFVSGIIKQTYLRGENFENTPGYLTMLLTAPECRGQGIGTALLAELEKRFAALGKKEIRATYRNPVNLGWTVPGTPGHDHNNAPGVDMDGKGYALLQERGYEAVAVEHGMYLDLAVFSPPEKYGQKISALSARGITVELYDSSRHHGFDELFDNLHGEVWRKSIADNLALPAPLPVIVASDGGKIVGFAGPIDKEPGGRGWFNGIATHTEYGNRGIAFVMFCRLMLEFQRIGAQFSTLFTDEGNPALGLYERVGFTGRKKWAVMRKELK